MLFVRELRFLDSRPSYAYKVANGMGESLALVSVPAIALGPRSRADFAYLVFRNSVFLEENFVHRMASKVPSVPEHRS